MKDELALVRMDSMAAVVYANSGANGSPGFTMSATRIEVLEKVILYTLVAPSIGGRRNIVAAAPFRSACHLKSRDPRPERRVRGKPRGMPQRRCDRMAADMLPSDSGDNASIKASSRPPSSAFFGDLTTGELAAPSAGHGGFGC